MSIFNRNSNGVRFDIPKEPPKPSKEIKLIISVLYNSGKEEGFEASCKTQEERNCIRDKILDSYRNYKKDGTNEYIFFRTEGSDFAINIAQTTRINIQQRGE